MYKVMIVDDDKLSRRGLISIISWEQYGMEVLADVSNGELALEFLQNQQADLLIVDLQMPVMNGLELIEVCKQRYPDMLFVVLTFHEDFEFVQKALRLGVIDYVSKVRFDKENYDEVFRRVSTRLKEVHDSNQLYDPETIIQDHRSGSQNVMSDNVALEKRWTDLFWLYDDAEFADLKAATLTKGLGVRTLDQLFILIERNLWDLFHYQATSSHIFVNRSEAMVWVTKLKEEIHKTARQCDRLDTANLCILKAILYVDDNLGNPIHTDQVANYVNMSRSYFSTSFKKITGCNFIDYLHKKRVTLAMRLLSTTSLTIEDIARAAGYEDKKYFFALFSQHTGCSMNHYREHSRRSEANV